MKDAGGRLQRVLLHRGVPLLLLSVLVGVGGGTAAVALRLLLRATERLAFGGNSALESISAGAVSWSWVVLAPALGGVLCGPIVFLWATEAKGSGVLEVIRAVQASRGFVRGRVILARTVATVVTLGLGGSAGQEGPIAQIGAGLGSLLGRRLGLRPVHVKVLTSAGVASGVAAAFNAPIAGAFFALEVVLGTFAMEHFAPVVLASVCATLVTRSAFGGGAIFQLSLHPHALTNPIELLVYAALGVFAAFVAVAFTRVLATVEDRFARLPGPGWLRPAVGGLGVGGIALLTPQVLGPGNDVMALVLSGDAAMGGTETLLVLLVAKLLATCLTVGSGGSGGVFSPSLFLGAVLGTLVGHLAAWALPFQVAPPGAYALVGMAAVASGTSHAPITMVLMLFELTGDYGLIAPLLVSSAVAAVLAKRLLPDSVFTHGLSRRGVRLQHGPEASLMLHDLLVEDVMRTHEAETVRPSAPLSEVTARLLSTKTLHVYVVEGNEFIGTIHLDDVKATFGSELLQRGGLVIAADVVASSVPTVTTETPLVEALDLLQRSGLNELPVLAPAKDAHSRLLGTVSEHDILSIYNQEVLRKHALLARFVTHSAEGGAEHALHEDYFELPPGFAMAQIPVPADMVGSTLAQAGIRGEHGLNVLAIKVKLPDGGWEKQIPDPRHVLCMGDLLVVMGPIVGVESLRPTAAPGEPKDSP